MQNFSNLVQGKHFKIQGRMEALDGVRENEHFSTKKPAIYLEKMSDTAITNRM